MPVGSANQILVVGLNFEPEPTGIGPYTTGMCRGLSGLGFSVHAVTTFPHYPHWTTGDTRRKWASRESVNGVATLRLRHYVPRRPQGIHRVISELTFGARAMMYKIKPYKAVVLVSPALISAAMILGKLALLRSKTPVILWIQDLYAVGYAETHARSRWISRLLGWLEGWSLRRAQSVVVIHERFQQRVHKDFGVPIERIKVIRNWSRVRSMNLSAERVCEVREAHGWRPNEFVVVHSGNMGVKQGLINVVMAAKLAATSGLPIRFVLVGNGSERKRITAAAEAVDTVQFIEILDDTPFIELLSASDCLLINEEVGVAEMALPSKLTTYLTVGRPIIAATEKTGITADELRESGAGLLVPSGDPQALIDGVARLARDAHLRQTLAAGAAQHRNRYLLEQSAIQSMNVLLESIECKKN